MRVILPLPQRKNSLSPSSSSSSSSSPSTKLSSTEEGKINCGSSEENTSNSSKQPSRTSKNKTFASIDRSKKDQLHQPNSPQQSRFLEAKKLDSLQKKAEPIFVLPLHSNKGKEDTAKILQAKSNSKSNQTIELNTKLNLVHSKKYNSNSNQSYCTVPLSYSSAFFSRKQKQLDPTANLSSVSSSSFSAGFSSDPYTFRKRKFSSTDDRKNPDSLQKSCSSAHAELKSIAITPASPTLTSKKKKEKMTQGLPQNSNSTNTNPNLININENENVNVNVQSIYSNHYNDTNVHDNENNPAYFSMRNDHNNNYSRIQNSNCYSHNAGNERPSSRKRNHVSSHHLQQKPLEAFQNLLKQRKLEMVEQEGDGNCLFRAISLQIYGDSSMHGDVRRKCLDFMEKEKEHFSHFIINEPFHQYIKRKRIDGVHGNNPEIQAISELFNRPVEVYVPENGAKPINIFHAEYKTLDTPIRLSYHDGNHYNAVIDPLCPTAGLGLGLPGLEPGLADRMQLKKAVQENLDIKEEHDLEKVRGESLELQVKRVMMESAKYETNQIFEEKAIALSDLAATDFDIEQMVLANSLKTFYNSEQVRKQPHSSRGSGSSKRRINNIISSSTSSNVTSASSFASRNTHTPGTTSTKPETDHQPPQASATLIASPSFSDSQPPTQACEEEYPQTVQELVMNGFELSKVLHAFDLIGNNFDDLLAFLMSSNC